MLSFLGAMSRAQQEAVNKIARAAVFIAYDTRDMNLASKVATRYLTLISSGDWKDPYFKTETVLDDPRFHKAVEAEAPQLALRGTGGPPFVQPLIGRNFFTDYLNWKTIAIAAGAIGVLWFIGKKRR